MAAEQAVVRRFQDFVDAVIQLEGPGVTEETFVPLLIEHVMNTQTQPTWELPGGLRFRLVEVTANHGPVQVD